MLEAWQLLAHLCADDSEEVVARVATNPVVRRLIAATVCPGVAMRLRQEPGSGVKLPWGDWEPPSREVLGQVHLTITNLLAKLAGDSRLLQCWQPFLLTLAGVYAPMELLPGAAGLRAVEDASTALTAAMDAGGGALRYEHKLWDEAAAGSAARLSLSYADCEIPDADAAARAAVNAAACAATGAAGEDRALFTPLACLAEYRANAPSPAAGAEYSAVAADNAAGPAVASAEPAVESDVTAVASDEAAAVDDAAPFDVAACLEHIMDMADVLPEAASDWIGELAELPSLSAARENAEDEEAEGGADGDEDDASDEEGEAEGEAEEEAEGDEEAEEEEPLEVEDSEEVD
jgi:hypothetical protein